MNQAATSTARTGRPADAFDHRDSGNPPSAWRPLLDALPWRALPQAGAALVVLAAHPDDETLGCGGTIAQAAAQGLAVTVIIATDGEGSHPDSPTHSPADLARIRRVEAAAAVAALAPSARLVQLGLPDGALESAGHALRDALDRAVGTTPAWVLAPWEQDRHPDHAACARAARHLAADRPDCTVAEYPIWAWHWADPAGDDLPIEAMARLGVDPAAVGRRREALQAYRSQVLPLSAAAGDEAVLGPHVTAHFDRPFDVLVDPRGAAARTGYFDALYAASDDPWGGADRWYERRKRALLLAALPRPRFAAAFEPGCGAGHLTRELAPRCDRVLATDAARRAVALAGAATAGLPGVTVRAMHVPDQWPAGIFDLIVLSEIGYYAVDPDRLAGRLRPSLAPDGVVVLCHWRHPTVEHPLTAEAVHEAVLRRSTLRPVAAHQEEDFLLDVLSVDGVSVARADGVLD